MFSPPCILSNRVSWVTIYPLCIARHLGWLQSKMPPYNVLQNHNFVRRITWFGNIMSFISLHDLPERIPVNTLHNIVKWAVIHILYNCFENFYTRTIEYISATYVLNVFSDVFKMCWLKSGKLYHFLEYTIQAVRCEIVVKCCLHTWRFCYQQGLTNIRAWMKNWICNFLRHVIIDS